jgi:hypothetical protein
MFILAILGNYARASHPRDGRKAADKSCSRGVITAGRDDHGPPFLKSELIYNCKLAASERVA